MQKWEKILLVVAAVIAVIGIGLIEYAEHLRNLGERASSASFERWGGGLILLALLKAVVVAWRWVRRERTRFLAATAPQPQPPAAAVQPPAGTP